ncbi:MAG: hypothetical protein ACC682_06205 [Gemmatimonadota bacterium]
MTESREHASRTWTIALLTLVGLAGGAGCGASIVGNDFDTGLTVLVLRGPIEPVATEGEPDSEPVEGATVRIRGVDGGSTEVRTRSDGTVVVLLLPGRYDVEVRDCPNAMSLPAPAAVDIVAGRIETIAFDCDTGIR